MFGSRLAAAASAAVALGGPVAVAAAPPAAAASVFTWSGVDAAGGNPNWSSGGNWVGGVAPTAGAPVDIVIPGPCAGPGCSASTNDVAGLVVEDLTVTDRAALTITGTTTLAGDLAATNSTLTVALALAGATSGWSLDDATLAAVADGGTHVAVTMADGSVLVRPSVLAISLSITGADPDADPAENGTVEATNDSANRSATLFSHVAVHGQGFSQPSTLTDGAAFVLDHNGNVKGFRTGFTVDGDLALDPGTTVRERGDRLDTGPGSSLVIDTLSHLTTTGSLDLGSALVTVTLGQCMPVGTELTMAESAPGGLLGNFTVAGPGGSVPLLDGQVFDAGLGACFPAALALQAHYDRPGGTLTATVEYAPRFSLDAARYPAATGSPITFTASVLPPPPGGTVAFTDDGSPMTGCSAVPVSTTTGLAACTTTYASPGTHHFEATYSGTPGYPAAGPAALDEEVVPPPTVTITTPSGLAPLGETIEGKVSDVGGPGIATVLLYYQSLTGGPSGVVEASCDCSGETSGDWSFTTPLDGVPGVYAFVAQAFDYGYNPSAPSKVIYQIIS